MTDLNRAVRRATIGTITVVACAAALACPGGNPVPKPPTPDSTEVVHQKLLEHATEDYSLGNPSLPVASDPLPISHGDSARNIQVFAFGMTPRGIQTPESRFVAAILSTRKYKRLGLHKGMNYILEITHDGAKRFVMVPDKENAKMFFLKDTIFMDLSGVKPPHVIREEVDRVQSGTQTNVDYVIGGCIEGCGSGHCGIIGVDGEFTLADARALGVRF